MSYLASTDEASLYCPRCRPYDLQDFVALADRVYAAIASGKNAADDNTLTDHPFARLLFRVSARKAAARGANTDRPQAPLGVPASIPGVVTDVQIRDHCCPRITLGIGLHSPTCKNFIDDDGKRGRGQSAPHETQQGADTPGQRASVAAGAVADPHPSPADHRGTGPSSPNLERDDPKAEVGSFERVMPWRPKYRNYADWDEWRRERAAIFEYLGGHDRKLAEFAANKLAGPPP